MRRRVVVRELEYLEQALVEAEAAARWYADRSPRAAARFSEELDEAESAILDHPHAWLPDDGGTRRYLLRRFPFSVVYRVEASRVVILAVAHARRRPGYWRHRTSRPA
jgi:plasmid stabilization system protein ParE